MKRDDILTELKRRLAEEFPEYNVHDGHSKYNNSQCPIYSIFEDTESSIVHKRSDNRTHPNCHNVYLRTIPIQIEFVIVEKNPNISYQNGRNILLKARKAIEVDTNFAGLCINYEELTNDILLLYMPKVITAIRYEFSYFDQI